jgi:hypothetical protein
MYKIKAVLRQSLCTFFDRSVAVVIAAIIVIAARGARKN